MRSLFKVSKVLAVTLVFSPNWSRTKKLSFSSTKNPLWIIKKSLKRLLHESNNFFLIFHDYFNFSNFFFEILWKLFQASKSTSILSMVQFHCSIKWQNINELSHHLIILMWWTISITHTRARTGDNSLMFCHLIQEWVHQVTVKFIFLKISITKPQWVVLPP